MTTPITKEGILERVEELTYCCGSEYCDGKPEHFEDLGMYLSKALDQYGEAKKEEGEAKIRKIYQDIIRDANEERRFNDR